MNKLLQISILVTANMFTPVLLILVLTCPAYFALSPLDDSFVTDGFDILKLVQCDNYRDSKGEFPKQVEFSCQALLYHYPQFHETSDEKLLLRDTIQRGSTEFHYSKDFDENVTSVKVLNVGEVHAFVKKIVIDNTERPANVKVEVETDEGHEAKLFVEVYAHK